MTLAQPERPGPIKAWAVAFRPVSLPLGIGPVVVGAAMGYLEAPAISFMLATMALAGALLMQLLTNLQNDIGFTERGGEMTGHRMGLPRASAHGWLSMKAIRGAIVSLCLVSAALGGAMVALRGWPVLAIGTASLLAALAYMGGPKPIAYTPFGELTVLVFFGWVAVMGTQWLLTDQVSLTACLASTCIGCLSAAALAVNNHRDCVHDRLVGRKTFVVCFGERASSWLLGSLIFCPFIICGWMAWGRQTPLFLLPLLLIPSAVNIYREFRTCAPGLAYNAILFKVFRLEMWFAVALSGAAVLLKHLHQPF